MQCDSIIDYCQTKINCSTINIWTTCWAVSMISIQFHGRRRIIFILYVLTKYNIFPFGIMNQYKHKTIPIAWNSCYITCCDFFSHVSLSLSSVEMWNVPSGYGIDYEYLMRFLLTQRPNRTIPFKGSRLQMHYAWEMHHIVETFSIFHIFVFSMSFSSKWFAVCCKYQCTLRTVSSNHKLFFLGRRVSIHKVTKMCITKAKQHI